MFWGNLRIAALGAWALVLGASPYSDASGLGVGAPGLCKILLLQARSIYTDYRYGPEGNWISDHSGIHKLHLSSPHEQNLFLSLWKNLRQTRTSQLPAARAAILNFMKALERYSVPEITAIAQALEGNTLPSSSDWNKTIGALLEAQLTTSEYQFLQSKNRWFGGWHVDRTQYRVIRDLQNQLARRGVSTEAVPYLLLDGTRSTALKVREVAVTPREQHHHALTQPFLFSDRAADYLNQILSQKGVLIIDPWLPTQVSAYFQAESSPILNSQWVIAIAPEGTVLEFEHEWQHKLDHNERKAIHDNQLLISGLRREWEELSLMSQAGHILETCHWCEVVATQNSIDQGAATNQSSHSRIRSEIIYHRSSLRQVALGRILQQPLQLRHYWLWLRSWWAGKPGAQLPIGNPDSFRER